MRSEDYTNIFSTILMNKNVGFTDITGRKYVIDKILHAESVPFKFMQPHKKPHIEPQILLSGDNMQLTIYNEKYNQETVIEANGIGSIRIFLNKIKQIE